MGTLSGTNGKDRGARKGRGSTDNQGRLGALFGAKASGSADWGGADARWVQAVVVMVTKAGGAVTFGLSRDGGAHMLTLLLDGERAVLWFNGDAELDVELEKVYQQVATLSGQ